MEVIQISTGTAVTLILAVVGMVFAFGKLLLSQFDKRMQERLEAQDALREQQIEAIKSDAGSDREQIQSLVAQVNRLCTTLPLEYVRREDWIRFSAVIEAKIDRLADYLFKAIGEPRARS